MVGVISGVMADNVVVAFDFIIGGLTKECVDAFVSMVYLYDDQTMKVEFNCEDVIRRALEKYGA